MKLIAKMFVVLSFVVGCDGGALPGPVRPFDNPDPALVRHNGFWDEVRAEGDWAEYKPTFAELADSADAVVVARLVSAEKGRVVQGDASEDVYTEMLVRAEVNEALRDSAAGDTVTFSLALLGASSLAERDEILARAQPALPIDNVLLLLRQRDDEDYYRVVNGYGMWAATTRSKLDAPLLFAAPLSGDGELPYERELGKLQSVEELVDTLR